MQNQLKKKSRLAANNPDRGGENTVAFSTYFGHI